MSESGGKPTEPATANARVDKVVKRVHALWDEYAGKSVSITECIDNKTLNKAIGNRALIGGLVRNLVDHGYVDAPDRTKPNAHNTRGTLKTIKFSAKLPASFDVSKLMKVSAAKPAKPKKENGKKAKAPKSDLQKLAAKKGLTAVPVPPKAE